jgi:RNA polymerase sigma-70 factor (ECF subfamily)
MIAVARQMPTFQYDPSIGSFKAWLFTITKWRIADQLRRRDSASTESSSQTATDTRIVERIPDPAMNLLNASWEVEWEKSVLAAALTNVKRRISPEKFQMFDLAMNKGVASEKVAELFSVSINQVYLCKHRVTELIRDEVERLKKEMP